jgi:hypothetical protein
MAFTKLNAKQLDALKVGDEVVIHGRTYGGGFGRGLELHEIATVTKITPKRSRFNVVVADKEHVFNAKGARVGSSYGDDMYVLDDGAREAINAEKAAHTGYLVLAAAKNLAKLDSTTLGTFFAELDRDVATLILTLGAQDAARKIISSSDSELRAPERLTRVRNAWVAAFEAQRERESQAASA